MDRRVLFLAFALVGLAASCSRGSSRERRPHVVQASENEPTVVETRDPGDVLAALSLVYVPIDPGSLRSLDVALEEKGYGNVTPSDLKRQFLYSNASFGRAMVAYSTDEGMAPNSLYETMPPSEWLEFALADETSAGVILDPGRRSVCLEKNDISAVLDRLTH